MVGSPRIFDHSIESNAEKDHCKG